MNDIPEELDRLLEGRVDAAGVAPVERFADAPEEHQPSRLLDGAKNVVVLGMAVPRGVLHSPDYGLHLLQRASHSTFNGLDTLGLELARGLESAGHLAVVVPSYAPLTVGESGTRGLLSLKHAAAFAGLGAFGRSGLVYNEDFGSLLRFGAVVTTADLEPSVVVDTDPCPPDCDACALACPEGAIEGGSFNKMPCVLKSITHSIFPIAFAADRSPEHRELVLNTAGYNYWYNCFECQKACPLNS